MKTVTISPQQIAQAAIPDASYQLNEQIAQMQEGDTLQFEQAEYILRKDYAMEKFCYISNNDAGIKNIAFPIIDKKNLVIDGNGASLMGISRIMPFYLLNSENITIQNFTIDYVRPFFTQGEILESDSNSVLLAVDKNEYPYQIKNGVVLFTGEDYESDFMHGMLEYEPTTKRPAATAVDNMSKSPITGREEGVGQLRLFFPFASLPTVGNLMTIKHERRFIPAITISNCKDITLKNIIIRHAGTMGVIAQFSDTITLDGVQVATDPNKTRAISANADATHFVNCSGLITVKNCLLESQLDDIINVHGNYLRVAKVLDNSHLLVEIPHFQQVGAFSLVDGANLTICDQPTMLPVGAAKLATSKTVNSKYYILTLEEPFAFEEGRSYSIDDTDGHPEVLFCNNVCGKNRARGLLLTSTKKMVIKNNQIDCEGSCVKVNSDMKFWYESSAASELIIRGNKMKRHNFIVWGEAIIDIDPGMMVQKEGSYFHGRFVIEDNEVELEGTPFLFGYSFEEVTVRNNHFIVKNDVVKNDETLSLSLRNYAAATVEGNTYTLEK